METLARDEAKAAAALNQKYKEEHSIPKKWNNNALKYVSKNFKKYFEEKKISVEK